MYVINFQARVYLYNRNFVINGTLLIFVFRQIIFSYHNPKAQYLQILAQNVGATVMNFKTGI